MRFTPPRPIPGPTCPFCGSNGRFDAWAWDKIKALEARQGPHLLTSSTDRGVIRGVLQFPQVEKSSA